MNALQRHRHWIFDMDGTLTVAMHDFDAIRDQLGLPQGRPILEALAELPPAEAQALHSQLNGIELEISKQARPAAGAGDFLESLRERERRLGILTRNNRVNVEETLRAAGLAEFFPGEAIVTRDDAAPKPLPEGIHRLLNAWQAPADDAVMVGDYLFDLQAGRAAGTATVYVDDSGNFPFREYADVCVRGLDELNRRET